MNDGTMQPEIELWRIYLDALDQGRGLTFEDGNEYSQNGLEIIFRLEENGLEVNGVPHFKLTILKYEGTFNPAPVSINSENLRQKGDSASIRRGDRVIILGKSYKVDIQLERNSVSYNHNLLDELKIYPHTAYALDIGHREVQEDALGWHIKLDGQNAEGLWLVADGVSNADGKLASRFAIEYVLWAYFNSDGDPMVRLNEAIRAASQQLHQYGLDRSKNGKPHYAATTLVAAALVGTQWHFASVGDSSIYLYRNTAKDYSNKEDARNDKGHLKYVLGRDDARCVIISKKERALHDIVMLCTDGISNGLEYGYLQEKLAKAFEGKETWQHLPDALVKTALQNAVDNHLRADNLAVVVIQTNDTLSSGNATNAADIIRLPQQKPELPALTSENKRSASPLNLLRLKRGKK